MSFNDYIFSPVPSFQVQDIMVGHCFEEQAVWDPKTRSGHHDYSKLSQTKPSFVWYPNPAEVNEYDDIRLAPPSWTPKPNGSAAGKSASWSERSSNEAAKAASERKPPANKWNRQSQMVALSERW